MCPRNYVIGLVVAAGMFAPAAFSGVVVVTNRAKDKVSFSVVGPDGRQSRQELLHGDVVSMPTGGSVTLAFQDGASARSYLLRANGIYYFRRDGKGLDLLQQPIPGLSPLPADSPAAKAPAGPPDSLSVIPVKLLADEKEPRVRRLWEKEYRERLAAASAVFEHCCRIRFQVVAVETWNSGDNAHDFLRLLNEFEEKVQPAPARLAIGFTGQYAGLKEDVRMGGARGPFRSHVLIREWGRDITESERLEILVHELGHYLGAVHSPEPQSVMRPDFSDRQSRARSFRIRFDATNTLIICLLDEAYRNRPIVHLGQLPSAAKGQLRPLYQSLAAGLPNDPAAPRYLAMLDQSLGLRGAAADHRRAAIAGAERGPGRDRSRAEERSIADAARAGPFSRRRPNPARGRRADRVLCPRGRRGRQAAPPRSGRRGFLAGIGRGLGRLSAAAGHARHRRSLAADRAAVATFRAAGRAGVAHHAARHDSAQHFAVSAALTVLVGPQAAEGAGILKEVSDAQGGSGFSFVDLMSDLAGIAFATAVGDGRLPLSRVEAAFAVEDFLPAPDGLKEGIAWSDFVAAYGSWSDGRWLGQRQAIRARILALAAYSGDKR